MFVLNVQAQDKPSKKLETSVDRAQIMMGEEIKYTIGLETDLTELIVFPELKNIGRLEVIESYPVDSVRKNDKWFLYKRYGITQFDSGDYWLPRVEVIRNSEKYKTDSLLVKVREVKVDTTKQKMFPIKDSVKIDFDKNRSLKWLWWLLLLIPVGVAAWLLSRKRTTKTYEETLQPFEWTKYRLQKLDESRVLDNKDWKEYYTELTYIIRKYLDSKVYGQALESTTEQLLSELRTTMSEKGMSITATTQARLEAILHRADLIKFAGASGDGISAKEDRLHVNDIIYNINQVLPQPTEEELLQDAKYQRKMARKKYIRKILVGVAVGVLALIIAVIAFVIIKGWDNVKDAVLGNELRDAYEQTWLTSDYGIPPITMSTPAILVRQDSTKGNKFLEEYADSREGFAYNEMGDDWSMSAYTYRFKGKLIADGEEIPSEIVLEPFLDSLEKLGAKNIVAVDDKITRDDIDGIVVSGTYEFDNEVFNFRMELFAKDATAQQILVTTREDNEELPEREFGRLLSERIFESVGLKAPANPEEN
ncbi:MAG: hypothetical protein NWQ09_04395 [Nonlabens sp.]|nr:hypothetical protein [Nonlabens sp.]